MFRKLFALVAITLLITINHSVAPYYASGDFGSRGAAGVTLQFDPPEPEVPPVRR